MHPLQYQQINVKLRQQSIVSIPRPHQHESNVSMEEECDAKMSDHFGVRENVSNYLRSSRNQMAK
jgi:hypothetical protein